MKTSTDWNPTAATLLRRNPGHVSTTLDGETVLMTVQTGRYYGMDPVASRIWELLEKPQGFGALVETLAAEYEGDRAVIEADLVVFLRKMLEENLILVEEIDVSKDGQ
jgi:hypothetical protein